MNEDKIQLNKLIRAYKGDNTFIISLKNRLKSKYITKVEYNGKLVSTLSDSQYEIAKTILKV